MVAEYKKDFIINLLFIASILGLIVIISKYTMAYFFPFIIGVIVALAVQKPAKGLSGKLNVKKQVCAVVLTVLICALTLAAVALGLWVIGGKLVTLISRIPKYFAAFKDSLDAIKNKLSSDIKVKEFESAFSGTVDSVISGITGMLSNAATALIGGLPAFLIGSIVTVVASCYIAKDFDRLKKFVLGIIPKDKAQKIAAVEKIVAENAFKFIKGYGIIAVITFVELSAALALLGVSSPVLKALVISLVDALPVLGIGTVIIPWATTELLRQNFYIGFGLLIS